MVTRLDDQFGNAGPGKSAQSLQIAFSPADCRGHGAWTTDVSNPSIALLGEMYRRTKTNRLVVASHKMKTGQTTVYKNRRHNQTSVGFLPMAGARIVGRSNEKPVDATRLEHANDPILFGRVFLRVAD